MKRLFLLCVCAAAVYGAPATVLVSQALYRADGTPYQGTLSISWQQFDTAAGEHIPAGSKTARLGITGLLSVNLVPNIGATPSGTKYTVTYKLDLGSSQQVSWVVPASGPVTVTAIESTALVGPSSILSLGQLAGGGATIGQSLLWNNAWLPASIWNTSGSDIYSLNAGNVGVGAAPGAYKLDVSLSGARGTVRFYDQPATTGATNIIGRAGAAQTPGVCTDDALRFLTQSGGGTLAAVDCVGDYYTRNYVSGFKKFSLLGSSAVLSTRGGADLSSDSMLEWKSVNNLDSAGSYDACLARAAAGVLEVDTCTAGTLAAIKVSSAQTGAVLVANLGTCNSGSEGTRKAVTDSNAASFAAGIGAVVAGGGTTHVPVFCDGTNWRIG